MQLFCMAANPTSSYILGQVFLCHYLLDVFFDQKSDRASLIWSGKCRKNVGTKTAVFSQCRVGRIFPTHSLTILRRAHLSTRGAFFCRDRRNVEGRETGHPLPPLNLRILRARAALSSPPRLRASRTTFDAREGRKNP